MKSLTTHNFDELIADTNGLYFIKFFSDSCGPCHTMNPVFTALEKNNNTMSFFSIDTGAYPELAAHFEVRGVPYAAFCQGRELLYFKTGVTPLQDLQFVIDNIEDDYFLEHGEFKKEPQKEEYLFKAIIAFIIMIFVALYFFI